MEHLCMGCMETVTEDVCPKCGFPAGKQNDAHQLPVGTVLQDQYIVGKVLGQGGFGITYLGWDRTLRIKVAIKEFYPGTVVNRDSSESTVVRVNTRNMEEHFVKSRARFLREAQALAKLKDVPEVVGIFGCFEANGTAYIVMEYVQGMELKDYVAAQGGKLTMAQTLKILDPVMEGLSRVHRAGLVHRDISPDNIMLHPMGGAKLLDFGAVRTLEEGEAGKDLEHSTEAIVKHGFAPAEQYRSRGGLGPWTDEYALCATVYYCVTGRVPPEAVARSLYAEPLDWSGAQDLTDRQRKVLEKGLAIRAEDRYPDLEALHRELYWETKIADPVRPGRGLKLALGAAAAALAIGAGFLLFGGREKAPEPPQTVQASESVPTEPVTEEATDAAATETTAPPTTEETRPPQPWENNIMMMEPFQKLPIPLDTVTEVIFLDTLQDAPENTVDVSERNNGSVQMWNQGTTVWVAAEGGINGVIGSRSLFAVSRNYDNNDMEGYSKLRSIQFNGAFHTDDATSTDYMFYHCDALVDLDLSQLNFANVQNTENMFGRCRNLRTLNLGDWDLSAVSSAKGMFTDCKDLIALDVSGWNTTHMMDMGWLFSGCTSLQTLDVSNWDTSHVRSMSYLFDDCASVRELDVSRWDTSHVEQMNGLFSGCASLESLDVKAWDTSRVDDMGYLFYSCSKLPTVDITTWDTGRVKGMDAMFSGCRAMKELDLSKLDTGSVTDMSWMFYNTPGLTTFDISGWDTSQVENVSRMFCDAASAGKLDLSRLDLSAVQNWSDFMNPGQKLVTGESWETLFENNEAVPEFTVVSDLSEFEDFFEFYNG